MPQVISKLTSDQTGCSISELRNQLSAERNLARLDFSTENTVKKCRQIYTEAELNTDSSLILKDKLCEIFAVENHKEAMNYASETVFQAPITQES